MYDEFRRKTSRLAQWARRLALFSFVLLPVSAIGHRYGVVETVAFFWLLGIVFALAVVSLVLAYGGYVQFWERDYKAGRASTVAMVVALLVLAPFAWGGYQLWRFPQLAQISTDPDNPPRFGALVTAGDGDMQGGFDEETAHLQRQYYPQVTGRRYDVPLAAVLIALDELVHERGWRIIPVLTPGGEVDAIEFEMEAPTPFLRFPADAAVRLVEDGSTIEVDMRLRSRHVEHDLGDNARRIVAFMADLDARVAEIMMEPDMTLDEEEDPVD